MAPLQRKSHKQSRARPSMGGLLLTSCCCLALASSAGASSSTLLSPDSHRHEATSSSMSQPSSCPVTGQGLDVMHERYHSDDVCDRAEFNKFESSFDRIAKAEALTFDNRHAMVPNERTVRCPAHVSSLYPPPHEEFVTGFDRSWVVENTATCPVVLLWVDPAEDGVEKSAFSEIVPPTHDPEAVLAPGEWTVVSGHDGHVFHVREILPDGTVGRVLLQHRLGWIPVGGKLTEKARQLVCPDVDERPVLSLDVRDDYDPADASDASEETSTLDGAATLLYDPAYERTPRSDDRHCNRQDVGFRNLLGCPVHGYYLEEDTCDELFKMHLGMDGDRVQDFMDDWASTTKFEASYFGHTFVFRSAHTGAEVDRVTLLPTSITDCPDAAQTVSQRTAADAQGLAVVRLEGDSVPLNVTSTGETWAAMPVAQLPYSFIKTRGTQR